MAERFLVTGANGCIGAWTVAQLVREGTPVVALDASDDDHRLRLVLDGFKPGLAVAAGIAVAGFGLALSGLRWRRAREAAVAEG